MPGTRRLTLGAGKKLAVYTVGEFVPDAGFVSEPARAFVLFKQAGDGHETTSENYQCLIARDGHLCDCAGKSYVSADRANERAFHAGRPQFPTLGCKHLDAVAELLRGGWLDLSETLPPYSEEVL